MPRLTKLPLSSQSSQMALERATTGGADRPVDCLGPPSQKDSGMAGGKPPEYGTLVTAALLILALAFAGYWI